MNEPDWKRPLGEAFDQALAYLEGLPTRPVPGRAGLAELRATLGGPLPERPLDTRDVVAELARAAEPGVVASAGGRYFGFVVGGATPAALAADWLTSAWDQNAGLFVLGPAASVVEEVAGAWLAELLGLPAGVSVGLVTGAQMANVTGLAIALREVLGRAGWDLASAGLWGRRGSGSWPARAATAPSTGHCGSSGWAARPSCRWTPTTRAACGRRRWRRRWSGGAGRRSCAPSWATSNSGAMDPVGEICQVAHGHGAWVHVDGAFGMWAAASPRLRPLVAGVERADSWATDAHKWLNVPYDSGLVFCAHPEAHRAAMGIRAGYLIHGSGDQRDALDHNPEHSRRARGFPVYAAIRALGREGVAELVERCCGLAARFAERLAAADGVELLNQVVLNQVLVRFLAADGDHDAHTRRVVELIQQDGTCWMSGTTWQGKAAMRISVSSWSTDEADVDRSVAAILRRAAE